MYFERVEMLTKIKDFIYEVQWEVAKLEMNLEDFCSLMNLD